MARLLPFQKEVHEMLVRDHALAARQHDVVGKRFTLKKVADHFACSPEGFFVLIESKATRTNVFQFARIKEHQRENLSSVASTEHGRAYLALNFREEKRPGHAWLIPWDYWRDDFERLWHKKSIRLKEAVTMFRMFELTRITGGWDESRQLCLT